MDNIETFRGPLKNNISDIKLLKGKKIEDIESITIIYFNITT